MSTTFLSFWWELIFVVVCVAWAAAAVKAIEKQQQHLQQQDHVDVAGGHQPCCLCAASGHGCGVVVAPSMGPVVPAAATTGIKKKDTSVNSSLGEIATGMMLATGFAHWGWGYGLGWNKPEKSIIGEFGIATTFSFKPISCACVPSLLNMPGEENEGKKEKKPFVLYFQEKEPAWIPPLDPLWFSGNEECLEFLSSLNVCLPSRGNKEDSFSFYLYMCKLYKDLRRKKKQLDLWKLCKAHFCTRHTLTRH